MFHGSAAVAPWHWACLLSTSGAIMADASYMVVNQLWPYSVFTEPCTLRVQVPRTFHLVDPGCIRARESDKTCKSFEGCK